MCKNQFIYVYLYIYIIITVIIILNILQGSLKTAINMFPWIYIQYSTVKTIKNKGNMHKNN